MTTPIFLFMAANLLTYYFYLQIKKQRSIFISIHFKFYYFINIFIALSGVIINNLYKNIIHTIFIYLKDMRKSYVEILRPSLINRRLSLRILSKGFKLHKEYYDYILNTYYKLYEQIELIVIGCTINTHKLKVSD